MGDDSPGDPEHGRRGRHVDIATAYGEDLADAGEGAEQDLDDLSELAVRVRAGGASCLTASPSTVLARLVEECDLRASSLSSAAHRATPISRKA